MLTDHKVFNYSDGLDYSILILLGIPLFAFLKRIIKLMHSIGIYIKLFKKFDKLDDDWKFKKVNEHIGHYYECFSGLDQKRFYTREVHARTNLKIKTMSNENLAILCQSQRSY